MVASRLRLPVLSFAIGLAVCLVSPAFGQSAETSGPAEAARLNAAEAELMLQQAVLLYRGADPRAATAEALAAYKTQLAESERLLTLVIASQPQDAVAFFFRAMVRAERALRIERELNAALTLQADEVGRQRVRDSFSAPIDAAYSGMRDDLRQAFESDIGPVLGEVRDANLLRAVAFARLVDLAGEVDPQTGARRFSGDSYRERIGLLTQAETIIAGYLATGPVGLAKFRALFYQGVVQFKLGSTREGEARISPDLSARLESARRIFVELSDRSRVEAILREDPDFFAEGIEQTLNEWSALGEFYLGLIAMVRGSEVRGQAAARALFLEARGHLERAAWLDTGEPAEVLRGVDPEESPAADAPDSRRAAGDVPPDFLAASDRSALIAASDAALRSRITRDVLAQYDALQQAIAALESVSGDAEAGQDLRITWTLGLQHDSNILLLGRNTAFPLDIRRKADWRFASELRLDYELDVGMLAPESEFLGRLTLALQGRVYNNWNSAIEEYNDQAYGGSFALQYRLLDQSEDKLFGPLYIGLQFDHDYSFLGNEPFLTSYRFTPNLRFLSLDERLDTLFYLRLDFRGYMETLRDPGFDRDGEYLAAGFIQAVNVLDMTQVWGGMSWGLPNDPVEGDGDHARWLRLYGGAEWSSNSTRGDEYDYNGSTLLAGAVVPLPLGVDFDFRGEWEWQDYWQPSQVDFRRRARSDFVQRYSFGMQRRFVLMPGDPVNRRRIEIDRLAIVLRAGVSMTLDDSNVKDRLGQAIFEYERFIYGISIAFELN